VIDTGDEAMRLLMPTPVPSLEGREIGLEIPPPADIDTPPPVLRTAPPDIDTPAPMPLPKDFVIAEEEV
jgi:hypothetical protein